MEDSSKITYFAETDHRRAVPFGIKAEDRSKHVYVIGKTGMGKSTMLENMAIQDIKNGNGVCFVDPHGKTAELLLDYVPEERIDDVIYFAPFDMEYPMSFNIMEDVGYDKRHLVANGLMSAFKKIWVDAWSARMEYILNNVVLALLEYPDSTLLGVNRMLTDKVYRKKVVDNITDPSTKSFWVDEFAKYTDRYTQEATPAIQNKVGQFTANPLIRNIIGQPKSSFDLRKVMDEKKIVVINLSKGRIGEGNANLLGSMLITKLYLSAMSRSDLPDHELGKMPNYYLFVDEFQSFANESFADILSEARKYKLNLTIAHQYIEQMPEEVRSAVFGNVGTMVSFRVGAYDAEVLEKEFAPKFYADDLVNLGFAQIYLKLMIDGVSSHPFSARTLPPIQPQEDSMRDRVVERSRALYAQPRKETEEAINVWYHDSQEDDKKAQGGDGIKRLPVQKGGGDKGGKNKHGKAKYFEEKLGKNAQGKPQPQRHTPEQDNLEQRVKQQVDRAFKQTPKETPKETPKKEPEKGKRQPEPVVEKPKEAVSLKALSAKDAAQERKKETKSKISENKDSLKEALAGVLGKQREAKAQDNTPKKETHVTDTQQKKTDDTKNNASTPHHREDSIKNASGDGAEKSGDTKKEAPQSQGSERAQEKVGATHFKEEQKNGEPWKKQAQEVPEEVLRKVLDVKDSYKKFD